jgi:hypothetical protein
MVILAAAVVLIATGASVAVIFQVLPPTVSDRFSSQTIRVNTSTPSLSVRVADVNSDSYDDLIVGTISTVELAIQKTDGSFPNTSVVLETDGAGLAVYDLDGDGHLDICARKSAQSLLIAFGNGAGAFPDQRDIEVTSDSTIDRWFSLSTDAGSVIGAVTAGSPRKVVFMSVNSSRHIERTETPILVEGIIWRLFTLSTEDGPGLGILTSEEDRNVFFFSLNGSLHLVKEISVSISGYPIAVLRYDFDEDGNDDVAVLQTSGNLTIIHPFSTTPTRYVELPIPTYTERDAWMMMVDMTGDGSKELVVAANTWEMTGQLLILKITTESDPSYSIWTYTSAWSGATTCDFDGDSDTDTIFTSHDDHTILIENEFTGTVSQTELLPKTTDPLGPFLLHLGEDSVPSIGVLAKWEEIPLHFWEIVLFYAEDGQ